MANEGNLKGKGFESRSTNELREMQSRGGKKSGETRRKKADFNRTLNALLTAKIDNNEWSPFLEALGLDSTVEAAVQAAMVLKAMKGDVRAYEVIAKYSGQAAKSEADTREQDAKIKGMELDNAEKEQRTAADEGGGLASAIMEAYEKRKRGETDA